MAWEAVTTRPFHMFQGALCPLGVRMSCFYLDQHEQLLLAVEQGDLERVKRLISSGISPDTVLHSRVRREGATVLSTAALEGQTEVMKYLVACRASINYQDPYFSRNALHWACIGNKLESVQLLLKYKCDVNCVDRDNVTPIFPAAIYGCKEIAEALVQHGACVNVFDRLQSSALHYASFHGRSGVVSVLVRAGCIANRLAIFGQGTPLANLIHHRDFENSILLVEAGYSLKEDSWIKKHDFQSNSLYYEGVNIGEYLLQAYRNPPSLKNLTRTALRKLMRGIKVEKRLQSLPLPNVLLRFLTLQHSH